MPHQHLATLPPTTYDPEADAVHITLAPRARVARTKELGPDVFLDLDSRGGLVALEILHASRRYDRETLASFTNPVEFLTLSEASVESGLAETTLRNQINAGRLPAIKRGRDWLVAGHKLWNYLESRSPRGQRSAGERRRHVVPRKRRQASRAIKPSRATRASRAA